MRRLAALILVVGCGGAQQQQIADEQQRFQCRDRIISYIAAHHMGGSEIGVQMDCHEQGPRIKRWRTDKSGNRQEDARSMTPGEFDKVWNAIDGTGWPNMRDCTNGNGGKSAPVYTFDIKDDTNQASFSCQSNTMPYPYNDLVDPLDAAAANGKGQLGDDEPQQLKDLEKKQKDKK
jgi:hypothetical protein